MWVRDALEFAYGPCQIVTLPNGAPPENTLCSNRTVYMFIMGHCGGDVYVLLMVHGR